MRSSESSDGDTTRRRFLSLTGAGAVGTLTGWIGTGSNDTADEESFPSYLANRVPDLLERYDIPGAAIALVDNGEITWTGAFGEADRRENRPLTTGTLCRPESITKSTTAWGVMNLVERGEIELDAPVGHYITNWDLPETEFDWEDVTTRRLLTNTAGLPAGIYTNHSPEETIPSLKQSVNGEAGAPAAPPTDEPGSSFRYSNPGFVLLELLIESVTERGYAEYMRAEILEPLGMETTTFEFEEAVRLDLATMYDETGEPLPDQHEPPKAHGRLFATVEDIATFVASGVAGSMGENPGRGVLKPDSVNIMHSPAVETDGFYGLGSDAYGLGHLVETLPSGQRAVAHGGQGSGSWSWYHAVPETGDGIVVLTNSNRSLQLIATVVGEWADRQNFSSVALSRTYSRVETLSRISVGVLGITSVGLTWRIFTRVRGKGRLLCPYTRRVPYLRVLVVGFVVALLYLWWSTLRSTVDLFIPGMTEWLSVAVTITGLLVLVAVATTGPIDEQ